MLSSFIYFVRTEFVSRGCISSCNQFICRSIGRTSAVARGIFL